MKNYLSYICFPDSLTCMTTSRTLTECVLHCVPAFSLSIATLIHLSAGGGFSCILNQALANQVANQTVINQTVSLFISKAPLLSRPSVPGTYIRPIRLQ